MYIHTYVSLCENPNGGAHVKAGPKSARDEQERCGFLDANTQLLKPFKAIGQKWKDVNGSKNL